MSPDRSRRVLSCIMTSLAARITAFPKANPFTFNLGVAAGKTSAADLMTQTVVERKGFGAFGCG